MKVTPEMLLFLAGKMGLVSDGQEVGPCTKGGLWISGNGHGAQFAPHTDKAQFADVVLWAAMNDIEMTLCKYATVLYTIGDGRNMKRHATDHDNTPAGIMEATVVAVCRALGWEDV